MRKKILELAEPISKTYLFEAFPLSIMGLYQEKCIPWILSNYIQLDCNSDFTDFLFAVFPGPIGEKSPHLKVQYLSWSGMRKQGIDIIQFIQNWIDSECYISFQVDEYYIEKSMFFQKEHHVHDLFVYGYDDEKNEVYYVAYDENLIYSNNLLTYENFCVALENNPLDLERELWADKILVYSYNQYGEYPFNREAVKFSISEYLSAKNSFEKYDSFRVPMFEKKYGVEVIETIKDYVARVKRHLLEGTQEKLDLRPLRLVMERSAIMKLRLVYISQNIVPLDRLDKKYVGVEEKIRNCFQKSIQYNVTFDKETLDSIYKLLYDYHEEEKEILADLLDVL
jgi:hypothetical protein